MTDPYCSLQALVISPVWTSQPIPLKTGVYQGDLFSGVIFNTVICTMADSLKSMQHLGYKFSGSQRTIHLLQYTDDGGLISDGPERGKRLLKGIERWLDWSAMKVKVPKCYSLALRASTAKTYDSKLHLHDQSIHFIGKQTIRFLWETVQIPFDSKSSRNSLNNLSTMLKKVDAVPITSHQKLLLYRAAVCPRLNWNFMVSQLPMSWVTTSLEATTTMSLKKWLWQQIPPGSTFQNRKEVSDFQLLAQSTRKQRSDASLILTSRKPVVQHIAHLTIEREQNLHRPIYRPTLEVRDIWHEDSDINKTLLKKEKIQATERESKKRQEHARNLQHQGELMRATEDKAASIRSSAVL